MKRSDSNDLLDSNLSLNSTAESMSVTSCIMVVGWLEFNGTFSTKRLYRALQKLKFVEFYFI